MSPHPCISLRIAFSSAPSCQEQAKLDRKRQEHKPRPAAKTFQQWAARHRIIWRGLTKTTTDTTNVGGKACSPHKPRHLHTAWKNRRTGTRRKHAPMCSQPLGHTERSSSPHFAWFVQVVTQSTGHKRCALDMATTWSSVCKINPHSRTGIYMSIQTHAANSSLAPTPGVSKRKHHVMDRV